MAADVPIAEPRRTRAFGVAGTVAFLVVAALLLNWAKWTPYSHKLTALWSSRAWHGSFLLDEAGNPGGAPSLHGAWTFTHAYALSIWPALVAGLVIASAVDALVPRRWLLGLLTRRRPEQGALLGAALALPSLMCTCCTAPVAATLRRSGVPTCAALAYWLGNPVLNPVVLVFLALVAPWQWVATRAIVGTLLVVAGSTLVARLADRPAVAEPVVVPEYRARSVPARFVATLVRLCLTLVPEYAVVVFALGLFRGWLFPLGTGSAGWGILAVVVAVVLGTIVVIPTAGEIPIVLALAAAGVTTGAIGALLITLPAISLVSMAMVMRAFSPRVTVAAAGAVAVAGLAGAALLGVLTL